MVGILVSFWDGLFSGAMLVSGRVAPIKDGGFSIAVLIFRWCSFKRFQLHFGIPSFLLGWVSTL